VHTPPITAMLAALRRRPPGLSRLRYQRWSIGLYRGVALNSLAPHPEATNPVLAPEDVTDIDAWFVADPFLLQRDSGYVMFFEVMGRSDRKGRIGLARSQDGIAWSYVGIVLDAPHHLSYPYVFEWNGTVYLLPETAERGAVTLYAAGRFPDRWTSRHTLLHGRYADPSIAFADGRWWLFVAQGNGTLELFSSTRLAGPYRAHPGSPVVLNDPCAARPAGRVFVMGDRLIRSAQVCDPIYGTGVSLFEITVLTPTRYEERPLGQILGATGCSWNAAGMHHLDAVRLDDGSFLATVDGWQAARRFPRCRVRRGEEATHG